MSACMLAEGDVAVDQGGFEDREFAGVEGLFAEHFVDGTGTDSGEEHALGIDPSVAFVARANEDGTGCAEGDELMSIDREITGIQRPGVLEIVACHPVVFVRGRDVFDHLTVITAMEFDSACARGGEEGDGKAPIVSHGDCGGFAIAGVALDADLFSVDGFIGFKVIEDTAGTPGPGTEGTPIVEFAWLAFVD